MRQLPMKSQTATHAKTQFGQLLDMATKEPIAIQKSGRNVAVIMSFEDYKRLTHMEDEYWVLKAKKAEKEGYLSPKESEKLLGDLLDAED